MLQKGESAWPGPVWTRAAAQNRTRSEPPAPCPDVLCQEEARWELVPGRGPRES